MTLVVPVEEVLAEGSGVLNRTETFGELLGPLMELDNRTRYGKVWKKGVGSSPPPGEASGNRVTPPSPLA
jgi:hypothetical protein